jgi:ATP-dependent DNA helicase RecG
MAHPKLNCGVSMKSLRAMQAVYPSTETLTNRGVTNRAINKMMQQLFIETQALFIETLPDYLLQELVISKKWLYSISISQKCRCFLSPIPT